MFQVNRNQMAEMAIAVTPVEAMMAAILYVDCSLQGKRKGS